MLERGFSVCQEQVSAYQQRVKHNRAVLRRLTNVVLFLAKQNMPLSGHRKAQFSSLGRAS